jgi:hypothetical protein
MTSIRPFLEIFPLGNISSRMSLGQGDIPAREHLTKDFLYRKKYSRAGICRGGSIDEGCAQFPLLRKHEPNTLACVPIHFRASFTPTLTRPAVCCSAFIMCICGTNCTTFYITELPWLRLLNQYDTYGWAQEADQGLPGLLADSLPDKFGHAIIDSWLASQGRTAASFHSVERLC